MRDWQWVALALLLLVGGFALQQFGHQSGLLSSRGEQARVIIDSDCDLRQGQCQLNLGGKPLLFSIEPRDIRVLVPLTLQLSMPAVNAMDSAATVGTGNGLALARVSVEFEGVNMDMGYNRVFLDADGKDKFVGSGMLPACTAQTMIWRVHLLLEAGGQVHNYRFDLETGSRR